MESFVNIKKKIIRYEEEITSIRRKIEEENKNLSTKVCSLMCETKFTMANFGGYKHEYYFCSSVSLDESWCMNGVKICCDREVEVGKLDISGLKEANSYEVIAPDVFFRRLQMTGTNLEAFDSPLAKECLLYKPKGVDKNEGGNPAVAYCRLSKSGGKHGYERQITSIKNRHIPGYVIDEYFKETITGTSSLQDRAAVKDMIKHCKANGIKTLFVSELNRIGRTKDAVMNGIKYLRKNGFENIYILHEGILVNENYLKNGGYNQLSSLAKKCEDDLNSIIYRMSSGRTACIENCKENGIKMGRPEGSSKPLEKYREEYEKELDLLAGGLSIRKVSVVTGTSISTIQRIKKLFKAELEPKIVI